MGELKGTEKVLLKDSRKQQWLHTLRACYENPTHCLKTTEKGENRTFFSGLGNSCFFVLSYTGRLLEQVRESV
ncbi:hypothetical protein LQ50_02405 [Halalkalibacter okhensis]|uniref:Uncharacterized protein n=1 Tax=Halalkalibacter okhensis TaxID=333138 RepID=A0A0B0INC7_9BACI|nr:hypothetical protein LQ50_02405 [Halalkalibacter okhensis]